MNIIEEIEAAACDYTYENEAPDYEIVYELVDSAWWPRIRAALEAAQEMDKDLTIMHQWTGRPLTNDSQRKFREAMERSDR